MARDLKTIYDDIITSKESKSTLDGYLPNPETSDQLTDDLESGSKVALWRLLYWIVAFAIWTHEQVFDNHKAEIETLVNDRLAPSLPWYQSIAFDWQYGDALTYINGKWQYPTVNTANQIIVQCAVVEAGRGLRYKVAKDDGGLGPLSSGEKSAFELYLKKRKAPGTRIVVISEDPDKLKMDVGVYVNPAVINASGELVADTSVRPVDVAINAYLEEFTTTDFNGTFRIQALVDRIQAVNGVVDVDPRSFEYKYGGLEYQPISVFVTAYAGYLEIDSEYPLDDPTVIEYLEA